MLLLSHPFLIRGRGRGLGRLDSEPRLGQRPNQLKLWLTAVLLSPPVLVLLMQLRRAIVAEGWNAVVWSKRVPAFPHVMGMSAIVSAGRVWGDMGAPDA